MIGFGKRLVVARESKGYKQNQLADKLGITATRLNYWEKDKREPDFHMFCKIVTLLETDPNFLLGLTTNEQDPAIIEYKKLNSLGKQKATSYIKDLSEQEKYTKPLESDTASTVKTFDGMQIAAFGGGVKGRAKKTDMQHT